MFSLKNRIRELLVERLNAVQDSRKKQEAGRDTIIPATFSEKALRTILFNKRAYVSQVVSEASVRIDKVLPDSFYSIRKHRKTHGSFPNIIRPVTFNEKVLHRILFDRRPILAQMADKAAVRSYVESRLGPKVLPELYYLTTQPNTIPFDQLPPRFVIKATHGSGWVKVVTDKSTIDRDALIAVCTGWLNQNLYKSSREWVYKSIEPRILVEEFIDDGTGNVPNDYKLFVFDGTVEMIQVDAGRFTDHRRRLYTPAWKKLEALLEHDDIVEDVPPPTHLAEMISAAETLGRGLDFVRADFYDTVDHIYFGELTTTPGGARDRFYPKEFDKYLGSRWKLPTLIR